MLMPSIMKALNDRAGVIRQIALYGMFSGLAAGVNIGSRYLFSTGGLGFTWSVILAYGLGMIVNFLLNRYYNFPRGPRAAVHEMRTFLVIAGFGLVITTVVSNLLIPVAHALPGAWATGEAETAAHVTAVALTAVYSYCGHKFFTFREGVRAGLSRKSGGG
jgi:putative flippase GtrA